MIRTFFSFSMLLVGLCCFSGCGSDQAEVAPVDQEVTEEEQQYMDDYEQQMQEQQQKLQDEYGR